MVKRHKRNHQLLKDSRVEHDLDAGHPGVVVPGDAVEGVVGEGERRLVEAGARGGPPPAHPARSAATAAAVPATAAVVAPILAAAEEGARRESRRGIETRAQYRVVQCLVDHLLFNMV